MGDDLGDEWWEHEGNSGIFLNTGIFTFCVCVCVFVRLVGREVFFGVS